VRKTTAIRGMAAAALAALALGAGMPPLAHEHHGMDPLPPAKTEMRSRDGRASVPFRLSANHVVIPITIQKTTLDVILDTGMPMDGVMLYRNEKAGRLTLPAENGMQARIGGAGSETDGVTADIVRGLTIDIDRLRLSDAKAIVVPPVRSFAPDHDGVIGASLFRNFVVEIDFDSARVTLHDPKRWSPPSDAAAVPLTVRGNMPFTELTVLTAEGRRIPVKVVVDLGAGHPVSLNLGMTEGIEAPAAAIRANIGRGLSGVLRGQVGRLVGVEIGGVVLRDVVATFPDDEHQRPGGMDSEGGNLGTGLLQHFNVAFDYAGGMMYLARSKAFDRPFEWDMSGLWLEPDAQASLRIAGVLANSAAEAAGLRVGDLLSQVNGKAVAAKDLPSLSQQFRKDGESLAVTLTRDGKPITATLRLKRLV
jgi:hypothetical protein